MGYMIRFRSSGDVQEYKDAGKKAKQGLSMVMEAVENNDMHRAMEGAEMAWKGVKQMCDISDEMEQQYGERRNGDMGMRDGGSMGNRYSNRDWHEWNQRDDEMMERRMRDAKGRYM